MKIGKYLFFGFMLAFVGAATANNHAITITNAVNPAMITNPIMLVNQGNDNVASKSVLDIKIARCVRYSKPDVIFNNCSGDFKQLAVLLYADGSIKTHCLNPEETLHVMGTKAIIAETNCE